jgi:hypothetical protein
VLTNDGFVLSTSIPNSQKNPWLSAAFISKKTLVIWNIDATGSIYYLGDSSEISVVSSDDRDSKCIAKVGTRRIVVNKGRDAMGIEGMHCLVMYLGHEEVTGRGFIDVLGSVVSVWGDRGEQRVWDLDGGNGLEEGVGCRIGTCYSRLIKSNDEVLAIALILKAADDSPNRVSYVILVLEKYLAIGFGKLLLLI